MSWPDVEIPAKEITMPPTTMIRRRTPATTGLTPAQFALAKAMPEEKGKGSLLSSVIGYCHSLGLIVAHFRPARVGSPERNRFVTAVQGDGTGYPDTTIAGGRWPMWRELKAFNGVVSPEQQWWIDTLRRSGGDADVWTPVDWYSGRIASELLALAGRADAA